MILHAIIQNQVRATYARGAHWHDAFARALTLGLVEGQGEVFGRGCGWHRSLRDRCCDIEWGLCFW